MKTYQKSHIITKNKLCYDNFDGDSMNNKLVGKFIAQTRKKKSLTQAQLGEKLGISDKAISKWERGLSAPDISILPQLSEILDVSIAEILLGKEIETPITKENANDITLSGIGLCKQIFRRRYTRIIGILIGIILLITVGFSTLYMITNYNQVQVYGLETENNDIHIEGMIVKNQTENSVIITKMRYENNYKGTEIEPIINKMIVVLYFDDFILYQNTIEYDETSLSDALSKINITINENKIVTEYGLNKLEKTKVRIVFNTSNINGKNEVYNIPIKLKKRFSNNKLVY